MANGRDVELRIRARDYSQKPLKAVTNAITAMSRAQEEQGKAAARGEISSRQLEASYRKLEDAGQQLLRLNSLVEVFKRQNLAMTEAAQKTEALKVKQTQIRQEYENAATATKKQEAALKSINGQVERAEKAEASRAAQVARTAKEMQRYGIATQNLGAAQSSILSSVNAVNQVLQRQENIIATAPAAAAQNKIIQGLQAQAQQAIAASRGYSTLGRVVQTTTGQMGPLALQIQQIVNPSEAARRTLGGLETQVTTLANEVQRAGKNVTDIAQKVRQLNDANKAVSGLAQQIDLYRQQIAQLRAARGEYQGARAAVQALAQQMRTATDDTGGLSAKMQQAQQRLASAAKALRDTGTAARTSQSAIRGAGIDTRNLTEAEQRLITTTQQSTGALNSLSQAMVRAGQSARNGSQGFSLFRDEGRTTLSVVQRLRGEVLALATAYVGFQGAINQAGGAVNAYKMRQQAMVKIATVVGEEQKALNQEWAYMVGLSDKLGIDIGILSNSYTRFAVAAKAVGMSLQDSKFIFESVAKAGRVFHLSGDDMNGIFRALEQMLSKGQVYAEELRGQLGERLPGAVALFAKGMNMTTAQLMKAMENGEVSGEAVINFAREQAKAIDAQLATAEKGVDAMEARARNAMVSFQLALADSGFIDAYVVLLEKITAFLRSSDGQEAAVTLGAAFTSLADALVFVIDNVDGLITILKILVGLKIGKMVLGFIGTIKTLIPRIRDTLALARGLYTALMTWVSGLAAASGAVGVLGIALKGLLRLIPFVGLALIAYDIGSILYEQSEGFREAVNAIVRDFTHLGNQLLAIAQSIPTAIYDLLVDILRPVTTQFSAATTMITNWIAEVLSLIPGVGESMSQWVKGLGDDLTKEHRDFMESTGKIWDEVDQKWVDLNRQMVDANSSAVDKIRSKMSLLLADLKAAGAGGPAGFSYTDDPESGVTERGKEIKGMTKALEKMEKAAKKADVAAQKALQRKNLPGRLAIIDEEFAPEYKRAKAIGGDEGTGLIKRLDAVVAARKKAETDSFNAMEQNSKGRKTAAEKEAESLEKLTAQYQKLSDSVGVKESKIDPTASFDDRLDAKLKAINTQYDQMIEKAGKLGAGGQELKGQIEALRQRNIEYATSQAKLEELKRVEDQLNAVQATKKSLLDEIAAKREAGVISEDEAVRQTSQLYDNMNATLGATTTTLEQLALQFKAVMTPEEFAAMMAKIAQIRAGLNDVTGAFTQMDSTVVQGVLDGVSTSLTSIKDDLVEVATGTMSIGDAFRNLGATIAKFFADFMMKIAMAIVQQMILNALAGWGGGIGGAATSAGGVAAKHNGGVIGNKSIGGQQVKSSISPAMFAGAQRFHTGGFPGLKSDEVPIIAQVGEQILSKDDPNNVLNQSVGGNSAVASPQDIKIINTIDSTSVLTEAMSTKAGQTVIKNFIKANSKTIKQILG